MTGRQDFILRLFYGLMASVCLLASFVYMYLINKPPEQPAPCLAVVSTPLVQP